MSNIVKMLEVDEGFRPEVYLDTRGYPTIGIGFCLDKITIPEHIRLDWQKQENVTVPNDPDDWPPMPKQVADEWLKYLVELNRKVLKIYASKFEIYENLSQVRQDVIDDMCYQLGTSGVCKFRKMWKCLKLGQYEEASLEMKDSNWHKQTTNRCDRLAWMMKFDKLHQYYK